MKLRSATGESYTSIAASLDVHRKTAARHANRGASDADLADRPRKGRPRITTARTDRIIAKLATSAKRPSTRKMAAQVHTTRGGGPSYHTVANRLHEFNVKFLTIIKKPALKPAHIRDRLTFARDNASRDWSRVVWADECKVYLQQCPRKAWQDSKKRSVKATWKHPGSLNFLGCVGANGVGRLHIFQENLTGAMMADFVEEHIVPSATDAIENAEDGWVLQHDNDPKFNSRVCKDRLTELEVEVWRQPAQSPDLNSMEHVWAELKKAFMKRQVETLAGLRAVLREEWRNLSADLPQKLALSMPKRLAAVRKAHGGATKY
jgi:transposase